MENKIRYEVHYFDKKHDRGFYIGAADACYSLEDAKICIDGLKLDENVSKIELWEITELINKLEIQ